MASLIVIGRPWSGPALSPRAVISSAAAAAARARSTSSVTTAFNCGFSRSMRSRYRSSSSRLPTSFRAIAAASVVASCVASASSMPKYDHSWHLTRVSDTATVARYGRPRRQGRHRDRGGAWHRAGRGARARPRGRDGARQRSRHRPRRHHRVEPRAGHGRRDRRRRAARPSPAPTTSHRGTAPATSCSERSTSSAGSTSS